MPIHHSGEDYLETILILQKRTGFVRSVDIASELNYSKPSISRAVQILRSSGFITVQANGQILLTEKGFEKANSVYKRHLVLMSFLQDILGTDRDTANEDACRIEHDISDETFRKLHEFVIKQTGSDPAEKPIKINSKPRRDY